MMNVSVKNQSGSDLLLEAVMRHEGNTQFLQISFLSPDKLKRHSGYECVADFPTSCEPHHYFDRNSKPGKPNLYFLADSSV